MSGLDLRADRSQHYFKKLWLETFMAKYPNEVFIVNYSKVRLGLSILSMSAIGLLSLGLGLVILGILLDIKALNWDTIMCFFGMLVAFVGALYTFKISWKHLIILFKNAPMSVLNHHGYGGVGFTAWHNYHWARETKFTSVNDLWACAVSIYTVKHAVRSVKKIQSGSKYVSIQLHLSDKSLKEVQRAFEYFNPFHQET